MSEGHANRTLALVIEYDGSGYAGFQRQSSEKTVAGELERALSALFAHPVRVVAAGRTDAGVHATGQVVSCSTTSDLAPRRIALAASMMLKDHGIAVLRAEERAPDFSARHHALARTYRYKVINRASPSPLRKRRALWVRAPLDLDAMRQAARALVGRHDFAAFAGGPAHPRGTVRTVQRIELVREVDRVDIIITANAFLAQMARIIVGTLLEVGRGRRPAADVERILASKQRPQAGPTAPAFGLYLEHVAYEPPL